MMRRTAHFLAAALLGTALFASVPADAEDVGIPVTIEVLDPEGSPITSAVVRSPETEDRHRVDVETGRWTASVLYRPDGLELVFEKGMHLEFYISAPGYENARISYTVRERKNLAIVVLKPMEFEG